MPDYKSVSPTGVARPGGPGLLAGRTVSRIGYGAMQLERLHNDHGAATTLLRRAVDLGVDHIDTAYFYGDGLVNGLLREALHPADGVLVASKVGAEPDPAAGPRCAWRNGPSSCGPASRTTCAAWTWTTSSSSTSAARTPDPAFALRVTRWSTSTTRSR